MSWENGVETYDASSKESFKMCTTMLGTINNFSAYGNLFGWSTKGYKTCPICIKDSLSVRLRRKLGYTGHRSFLPKRQTWRRSKDFNRKVENRVKSMELPLVEKVQAQLERPPNTRFGKHSNNKKRPRDPEDLNWTKKSIFMSYRTLRN